MKALNNLKAFEFEIFKAPLLSDSFVLKLADCICKTRSFQELGINLRDISMSKSSCISLLKAILMVKIHSTFILGFSTFVLLENEIEMIFQVMLRNPNLKKLVLSLVNTNISAFADMIWKEYLP